MKITRTVFTAIAVLSSASGLLAGPGIDYWTRRREAVIDAPTPAAAMSAVCPDSRTVPVYTWRQDWPNGKGTPRLIRVGEKVVCNRCDTPMTTMRPSGHNGKGPMQAVTVSASHECTVNCPRS